MAVIAKTPVHVAIPRALQNAIRCRFLSVFGGWALDVRVFFRPACTSWSLSPLGGGRNDEGLARKPGWVSVAPKGRPHDRWEGDRNTADERHTEVRNCLIREIPGRFTRVRHRSFCGRRMLEVGGPPWARTLSASACSRKKAGRKPDRQTTGGTDIQGGREKLRGRSLSGWLGLQALSGGQKKAFDPCRQMENPARYRAPGICIPCPKTLFMCSRISSEWRVAVDPTCLRRRPLLLATATTDCMEHDRNAEL